jgi:hypothetical protein
MPASASPAPSVPFPVLNAPHANGPMGYQQPANALMRPQHRHGHSADHADPSIGQKHSVSPCPQFCLAAAPKTDLFMEFRVHFPQRSQVRRSEQILSKPLPTRPEQDNALYMKPSDKTVSVAPSLTPSITHRTTADPAPQPAERYKERSLQKLEEKEGRSKPLPDHFAGHPPSGSVGRRATVDAKPSSGSRASNGVRRKPVQTPTPQEFFNWPDEPQVITTVRFTAIS